MCDELYNFIEIKEEVIEENVMEYESNLIYPAATRSFSKKPNTETRQKRVEGIEYFVRVVNKKKPRPLIIKNVTQSIRRIERTSKTRSTAPENKIKPPSTSVDLLDDFEDFWCKRMPLRNSVYKCKLCQYTTTMYFDAK